MLKKFLVSLSQNYRSTQRILRVAGEVISHNEKSPLLPPKNLTTENPEGEKIRVVEFGTPEEEAYWVTSEIERLHAAGAPWRDFAVLYRKHTHREQAAGRAAPQRDSVRHSQIFDSIEHGRARSARLSAPGRRAGRQRVLRARAGRAVLGTRAARSGAPRGTRRKKSPAAALADELETAQREAPFNAKACGSAELVQLLGRAAPKREGNQREEFWTN